MASTIELNRISAIWPSISQGKFDETHYSSFLKHLKTSAEVLSGIDAPYATSDLDQTLHLLDRTRQMVQANNYNIQNNPNQLGQLIRHAVVTTLIQSPQTGGWRSPANTSIVNSLCLALSLRIGFEVSPTRVTRSRIGATQWPDTLSISDMINDAFPVPDHAQTIPQGGVQQGNMAQQIPAQALNPPLNPAAPQNPPPNNPLQISVKLQPVSQPIDLRLTLEYLCTYHSFDVLWTSNLKEHLQIQWQGKHQSRPLIMIYQHKIFLWNELRFPSHSLLPPPLVSEALDTLNLLLPYNSTHTSKFLASNKRTHLYALGWCGRSSLPLHNLSHYHYFRDQIAELSDIVNGAPTGIPQLKLDRGARNLMGFLNFWVALLVGVFTIFSIAFGSASLVLSKWQYDLGVVQYQLSLAQACLTPNATSLLPRFCADGMLGQ